MIDLSIIIPVYNVEKYLTECIDSVMNIKELSVQIICVNDNSSDSSLQILNGYENVEVYNNDGNRGLSYSRNNGINKALGKYILFLDGDDLLNGANIPYFVDVMNSEELDVLYFDSEEFSDELTVDRPDRRKRKSEYQTDKGLSVFDKMIRNNEMHAAVWSGIYRRDFLIKNQLAFIDRILHEDIPFTFNVLAYAQRVKVINISGYYYRQRSNSIMHDPTNYLERIRGLLVGCSSMYLVWNSIGDQIENAQYSDSVEKYFYTIFSMIEEYKTKTASRAYRDNNMVKMFFDYFDFKESRRVEAIFNNTAIEEMKNDNAVAIYGAGKIAHEVMAFCSENDIGIKYVFVTDEEGNSNEIYGIPVIEYNSSLGRMCERIIIAIGGETKNAVKSKLLKDGYKGRIVMLPF